VEIVEFFPEMGKSELLYACGGCLWFVDGR
jgi:hypothetical protein